MGICAYAKYYASQLGNLTADDFAIFTTACDQMRRISELATSRTQAKVFLFNMPTTWQSKNARNLYKSELDRLAKTLSRASKIELNDEKLFQQILRFDKLRTQLRSAIKNISATQACKIFDYFREHNSLPEINKCPSKSPCENAPKIALLGGPVLHRDRWLLEEIESAGGCISLDATTTGLRSLPGNYDLEIAKTNPVQAMTNLYFDTIWDAFRRPDFKLYDWLNSQIAEQNISGIILHRYVWCDTWQAVVSTLENRTNLPVLNLDSDDEDLSNRQRIKIRIQAFLEMLS